jgi:hypothetical protein
MALTVLNQIKEIRASGEVVLWVDNYTNDDTDWVIVGTDPLSSIDYPNAYIVSRSDRPCVTKWNVTSPINMTGTKDQMPQYRVDVYARAVNGSSEVIVNGSVKTVGSSWSWINGTASSFSYLMSYINYSDHMLYPYPDLNHTIIGKYITCSTNGRAIYIYASIYASNDCVGKIKGALYKKSNGALVGVTEELNFIPGGATSYKFEFADPKPYLEKDVDYYVVVWGNVSVGSAGAQAREGNMYVGRGLSKNVVYGDFPDPLTNYTTTDFGVQAEVYVVPEQETVQFYLDKRYLGTVEIDCAVVTYWNSTHVFYQTPVYSGQSEKYAKTGVAPYLGAVDYPNNYISWTNDTTVDAFFEFPDVTWTCNLLQVTATFYGNGSVRYYLLSPSMDINYTNYTTFTPFGVTVDITAFVNTSEKLNSLRLAFRSVGVSYVDAVKLTVTLPSLNLRILDANSAILDGATVYINNGTEYSMQVVNGWANWTGITASTVDVKVKWQDCWVNDTFTVTMDAMNKTLDVTCNVYSFAPQAFEWDLETLLTPGSQIRLTAPNGTQTGLISLGSSASYTISQAQNGTWKIEVFWNGMKVNETEYFLDGNVPLGQLKLQCQVWNLMFQLKDSNGNFLTTSPAQVYFTYPNATTLMSLNTTVGYGNVKVCNGTSYYMVKYQDVWVTANTTLSNLDPSTTLVTATCNVYKLTVYVQSQETGHAALGAGLVLKRVEDSVITTLNGLYGLPASPVTGEYNLTHARYIWPQLAIQNGSYVIYVYLYNEERGGDTVTLTANTVSSITVSTAAPPSPPGPGPGPSLGLDFRVEDTYLTVTKGETVSFDLKIVWTNTAVITISKIQFQDRSDWFTIVDELPKTVYKPSGFMPEGNATVAVRVTVPWDQQEGTITLNVVVTCPSAGGMVERSGVIYLTVTGKQLAPPGSIPGFMTYVFLGMLLLLCVYAFAKKR